jgi:glycyl-tRNA synthetase alpha subunit
VLALGLLRIDLEQPAARRVLVADHVQAIVEHVDQISVTGSLRVEMVVAMRVLAKNANAPATPVRASVA